MNSEGLSQNKGERPTTKAEVIEFLNRALATEIVCVLRYRQNYETVTGISGKVVAEEFLEHAKEEEEHSQWLATRISQLGGVPNFNPDSLLSRSHTPFVDSKDLHEMLRENLIAERTAIDVYTKAIRSIGNQDPTTRRLLEKILAAEEEHANDLLDFLKPAKKEAFQEAQEKRDTAA